MLTARSGNVVKNSKKRGPCRRLNVIKEILYFLTRMVNVLITSRGDPTGFGRLRF
jgi:hypothetical protein